MQLPCIQVSVKTKAQEEQFSEMTYCEMVLKCHLPNEDKLKNENRYTRLLATFIYFALYKQITGKTPTQEACATQFDCGTTPFKRLVTGVKQPCGPGRPKGGKLAKSVEDVKEAKEEGEPPSKHIHSTKKKGKKDK